MYNGIGLTTPRGSGTSGYVTRNLSTLRVHDRSNDKSAWDAAPPKHREPDEAILEHERKRKVEIKCLELQDALEEQGLDETEIEAQVDQLRQKLVASLSASAPPARGLKPSDTHGMAAAKKVELSKMARAFGTRADYQEGDAFDREKQEEHRIRRIAEREEREKSRAEHKSKMAEQKAKWEEERREREKLRRKEEEKKRAEKVTDVKIEARGDMPPPSHIPTGPRREYRDRDRPSDYDRARNPPRRGPPPRDGQSRGPRDGPRYMGPPPPRGEPLGGQGKRDRPSHSPSRSRSPPPRNRQRVDSRSPSRSPIRSRSRSPRSPSRSRSRSPVRRVQRRSRSRSVSPMRVVPPERGARDLPPHARGRGRTPSRSPSRSRSRSPRGPPPRALRRGNSRSFSRSPLRSKSRSMSPPRRHTRRSVSPSPPQSGLGRQPPSSSKPVEPVREPISRRGRADSRGSGKARREIKKARSRSGSTGSSMSVSTRSGGSGGRSRSRS